MIQFSRIKNGKNGEDARQLSSIYTTGDQTFKIIVRESKLEADDLFETIFLLVSLAIVLLVSGLYFVNYKVAKSVWKSFYINLGHLKGFSLSSKTPLKLQETNVQEFKELNSILENLTTQAMADYHALKQFTEDASHEIQTPLAVIQSKIESILNENGSSPKQIKALRSIEESVNRLVRLNKNLLLLAKLENKQFIEASQVNLTQLLETKINEWKELIDLKGIQITSSFSHDMVVEMSPTLAEILMANLLSNAINHTPKGGEIKITSDSGRLVF